MISKELQTAIDAMHIRDVYLRGARSLCADGFYPETADFGRLVLEHMHVIRRSEVYEAENDGYLLRVVVGMGVRWVVAGQDSENESEEGPEPDVKALIEADFLAEYQFTEALPGDCIHEFADRNVSHHVWPYWREYVSSQTDRLRLPRVILPTMQLPHHRREFDPGAVS